MDMIKTLLQRFMGGLSSDAAGNAQTVMWATLGAFIAVIASFVDEQLRLAALVTVLIGFCGIMAAINWKTKGSGLTPMDGAELRTRFLEPSDDEVAEALRRVRGND